MIITSFSQKGYHDYGKRFIETFLEHWTDEKLRVYYERGIPTSAPRDERVEYVNLYDFPDFVEFENVVKESDPMFSGIIRMPDGKNAYNFRFDVNRFYRKVFCMFHACTEETADDRVAWVDADVYFHNTMPQNFLRTLVQDSTYIAHLQREWLYSETGFVAFNTKHSVNKTFMELFMATYFNGSFKLLGEWHDCYVLDYLIKLFNVSRVNLTTDEKSNHPFNDSVLGKFMDHMKGPQRKENGKSHEHELTQKTA